MVMEKDAPPKWPIYILLFTSVDTYLFGTNSNRAFLFIPRVVGLLFILGTILLEMHRNHSVKLRAKELGILSLLVGIVFISSIVNSDSIETSLSRAIVIITGYTITRIYKKVQFARIFNEFVYFLSCFAIILEIASYLMPSVVRRLPAIINTSGVTIRSMFLGGVIEYVLSRPLIRMNSIFWEPSAFAVYLIFAIIFELFFLDNFNYKRVIIYVIALITTFSTTGYVSFSAILIGFVLSNRSDFMSKSIKCLFVVVAVVVLFTSVFVENGLLYNTVFSKLTSGTSSATTRYSSVVNGMKVALSHPVIGVGTNINEHMKEFVYASSSRFNNGGTDVTNTIVGQFVSYGFIFGMVFTLGSFLFLKQISRNKKEWFFILLAVIIAYSGEKFFSFFPFVFMFYGFQTNSRHRILTYVKGVNI